LKTKKTDNEDWPDLGHRRLANFFCRRSQLLLFVTYAGIETQGGPQVANQFRLSATDFQSKDCPSSWRIVSRN